ncbi:MAG: VanW family protein [Parcubacteria group bacterium Gr01-1014_106]|nr:MAG: VanW family protein [Parcubacteria group bacterium Gr01-1014_106]
MLAMWGACGIAGFLKLDRTRECIIVQERVICNDASMRVSRRILAIVVIVVLGCSLAVSAAALWGLPYFFEGKVLPGVSVHGVSLSGKTHAEAREVLAAALHAQPPSVHVTAMKENNGGMLEGDVPASVLGAEPDLDATAAAALAVGREGGWRSMLGRVVFLRGGIELPISWRVSSDAVRTALEQRFPDLFRTPIEPAWKLGGDGTFSFHTGEAGSEVALNEAVAAIHTRLAYHHGEPVTLRMVSRPPQMRDAVARVAGATTAQPITRPLTLLAEEKKIVVSPDVRAPWVSGTPDEAGGQQLSRTAIEQYLRSTVVAAVGRAPVNAQLQVSGNRATVFTPPAPGRELLVAESATGILRGLAAGAETVKLVTRAIPPAITATPEMDAYGIRSIVARGESDFSGSPRNRRHNIRVGAEKYHGLLIPPGAEFSFNTNLGPVDGEHGFLPELVILHNVTTPQFGGGLCQVSTTMFRTAVLGGFPVTARKNHAYAVSYYGKPGFDATIYPPNPDMRFVNDTPGHLLVQMQLTGNTLAFAVWGTPDGRKVEVQGPFAFDRKPSGAVKARLVRKVTKGGQTTEDEWLSNYKSPKLFPKVLAANAEKIEQPAAPASTPQPSPTATLKPTPKPTPEPTPPPEE